MKQPRIYIGPVEIAGYYQHLAAGFRQLGVDCDFIPYYHHHFGYTSSSKQPRLLRVAWRLQKLSRSSAQPLAGLATVASGLLCRAWGLSAIFRYDVYIFGFGRSLEPTWNLDLPILKWLGKTVISNLGHGSEARPAYLNGIFQDPHHPEALHLQRIRRAARASRQRVARHECHATYRIGAPLSSSQFATQPMINWFALGLPCSETAEPSPASHNRSLQASTPPDGDTTRAVRILHSPSRPWAKGSAAIGRAIDQLRRKGHAIEFVQLQGVSNAAVLEAIRGCDFVVDQLYSDTPLATFAVEAAWQGKPAVVGGYGLGDLASWWGEGEIPASRLCHPDDIEAAIEALIVDPAERQRLGREAQRFVRDQWSPEAVARRYLRLIAGDIPDHWWFDPHTIAYCHGCGQPAERSRTAIGELLRHFGPESLQLQHRPGLLRRMMRFAAEQPAAAMPAPGRSVQLEGREGPPPR